jgi:hypothetical protein
VKPDALSQRQFLGPVNNIGLPPHVSLPGIGSRFSAASGILFAAKRSADLGPRSACILDPFSAPFAAEITAKVNRGLTLNMVQRFGAGHSIEKSFHYKRLCILGAWAKKIYPETN